MARRFYISRIVGNGGERVEGDPNSGPFRAALCNRMTASGQRVRSLGIPTGVDGTPVRMWTLVEVDSSVWTEFDAEAEGALIADRTAMTNTLNNSARTRINNRLSALGVTTRAVSGDTLRTLVNKLQGELGALERL